MSSSLLCAFFIFLAAAASRLPAATLQVLEEGADGLTLEFALPPPRLEQKVIAGRKFDDLVAPGYARLDQPGQPALPFVAEVLAVPPGARVEVEVHPLHYIDVEDIFFVPAPHPAGAASQAPVPQLAHAHYQQDVFAPQKIARSEYMGILRGVSARALRIYPFSYNPARRILRVYDRLRIQVRFRGGSSSKAFSQPFRPVPGLYEAFLNTPRNVRRARPPAARSAADWYDPGAPWIKVFVERHDGLYRIDPAWLEKRNIDLANLDPRTLRLFYQGEEQSVYVRGEADGFFDADDYLLFHGRFRRDEKNFYSPYGRRNTYWLTWGGELGRRLRQRSGAPLNNYPPQRSYWTTTHHEQDLLHDPLRDAPDNQRDHWFWGDPVRATKPDVPGARVLVGNLDNLDTRRGYDARIRVALHGQSGLGHHTVIQLNQQGLDDRIIDERIWEGQVELLIEKEFPAAYLKNGKNRVLLKTFADQAKFDLVYMNWFEFDYLRFYRARDGYLDFEQPPSEGHRISVSGFRHRQIELFDMARGIRFFDVERDSAGTSFGITFEDAPDTPALYVAADSLSIRIPTGLLDRASGLRRFAGADYLIITHHRFTGFVEPLAAHRRANGLAVEVIDVQDIYDEFSAGLADQEAVREFIHYAYHNWQVRPAYVLLVGDSSVDFEEIFVPTLYYQARGRGNAASDYLYALVDGDDILPDLAIGRLPIENGNEVETMVDKIIGYDRDPEPGNWRSRVIYLANHHQSNFIRPSNQLAERYTDPLGLEGVKIFNPDEAPSPNPTGLAFIEAFNEGALLINYNGHGSPGSMAGVFGIDVPEWGYLAQLDNARRLPLVLAFSCLNGLFVNPKVESLGEVLTTQEDGVIAYISATAKSYVAQNNLLADRLFNQLFNAGNLEFGPALDVAKIQVLAAHYSYDAAALTMQLFGDPAQKLALPQSAEYAPLELEITPRQVIGHTTPKIRAVLRNNGRATPESLAVAVLGHGRAEARPETLFYTVQPPFSGVRNLSFDWSVQERRGPYRLELWLDPEDEVAELDEANNQLQLDLEILEPLIPAPIFPAAAAVVPFGELHLEALLPLAAASATCEFALATDVNFSAAKQVDAALVAPAAGLASYRPELAAFEGAYFWKTRLHTGAGASPWSPVRTFRTTTAQETPPRWKQEGVQLLTGASRDLALGPDEQLTVAAASLPLRPSSATREDGFTVRGLEGAGVLCTDGTHLYAKRWYNDDSTIYPGSDFFARIGTGFNDTRRDLKYGVLADSTTAGISATYHSDGYIYNDSGKAFELERILVESGDLDTVEVAAGLTEWQSGQIVDGHSLFTSDGRYIYNVAMSSEAGMRAEWRVRVFDPAAAWSLVREFTSPPTENGFTFKWTDGILADGERLYFIEFSGQRRIRMVDAFDGRFLDEWTSDQDTTRIITGQYDWINNKVWLGDLQGSAIFRYTGLGRVEAGALESRAIGPAAAWQRLDIAGWAQGDARLNVDLQVRDQGDGWVTLPDFADLSAGSSVDLSGLDASRHPEIRLRADLRGSPETVQLESWALEFTPRPSLQLEGAQARLDSSGLWVQVHVRNLSAAAVDEVGWRLERGDQSVVSAGSLGALQRGETRALALDSLALPPPGERLFIRVGTSLADADSADNRLEIPLLFEGRAPLSFQFWPGEAAFLEGDPLRPGQGLVIQASGVAEGRILLAVDGIPVAADSLLAPGAGDSGPRILYRPQLAPGGHVLEARLFLGTEELGRREMRFFLSEDFAISKPLIYPHPVRRDAVFTYVLSHDASVELAIYTLSGRLVCRLGPQGQPAGFQQLSWDGRDQSGRLLANGTYLYRIVAVGGDGDSEVRFRGPLSVLR